MRGPLDPRVRDEIVAETGGDPLALLELPRGMTAAQLAGGFGLPRALGLSASIEESFRGRAKALPPEARRLLLAAAVAFLERSVLLTADPVRRAERTIAAAMANVRAGAFDSALELLATAEAGPLDGSASARVDLLRGQIAFATGLGRDAPPQLLKAAKRLEPFDLPAARDTYLGAWGAALFAGRLAELRGPRRDGR